MVLPGFSVVQLCWPRPARLSQTTTTVNSNCYRYISCVPAFWFLLQQLLVFIVFTWKKDKCIVDQSTFVGKICFICEVWPVLTYQSYFRFLTRLPAHFVICSPLCRGCDCVDIALLLLCFLLRMLHRFTWCLLKCVSLFCVCDMHSH